MAYTSWSVVYGEQPSAAKWNILGTNDASFADGTGLNTGSVQQRVSTVTGASSTGSTAIPADDTIPQITEGNEYMTLAITPKSVTNVLRIDVTIILSSSVVNNLIAALFQDAAVNALAVAVHLENGTSTGMHTLNFSYVMTAGTTSATTFRVRAGGNAAGTTTFNGQSGSRRFGGAFASSIIITEHKA